MKIGLLGMGTIGSGVYEQLENNARISVGRVLDLRKIPGVEHLLTTDFDDILQDPSIDTVVELMGGAEPAHTFAVKAMQAGKNFVSANKLMIARFLPELAKVAGENGVELRFSPAVGGGIPYLFNLLRAKRADRILKVGGIVNGTTNFILDMMQAEDVDFDEALSTARELGYAEANPANDIDGLDAENKIAIAATLAFDRYVTVEQVLTEGIGRIRKQDIAAFRSMGRVCRFLARACVRDGKLSATVEPTLVGADSIFAGVRRNFNMIGFTGAYAGEMNFMGQGAGKDPTAFSVVEDLTDVLDGNSVKFACGLKAAEVDEAPAPRKYYVRTCAEFSAKEETLFTADGAAAYITRPLCPGEMHRMMGEIRAIDPDACFAAIDE